MGVGRAPAEDPSYEGDLSASALRAALGDRPLRTYPALLSTEADALAWARAGAPAGAVVVADYQASPRGRAGQPWQVRPGEGLGFSLVLRPDLPAEREGWLYVAATVGLADVVGADAAVGWPDEVSVAGSRKAAVGMHVELGHSAVAWAVVTFLAADAGPPRGDLLAALVRAVERRVAASSDQVLADYLPCCATLGRHVRARMIPLGPSGPQVVGRAVDVRADGALVVTTERGVRVAVHPQHLGVLQDIGGEGGAPLTG
ncbi:MAG: hypothetical protein M3387_06095 [Actinomycetota bacterium]|nr:hypothetical protein [Actinomycetota bacterium]